MDAERSRQLLMAYLDGELEGEEAREFEAALAADPQLADELLRLERLGHRLRGLRIKDPADEVLAELERTALKRAGLPIGWILLIAGLLLLLAWLGPAWLLDPELPLVVRIAGAAGFVGLLLLFFVKVRERWIERRHDPYRDVLR